MAIIDVSTAAQLQNALRAAAGGDTIRLASGDYGDVTISSKSFTSDVIIKSADAGHPAVLNSLVVSGASGLHFDHINVDYTPTMSTFSFSSVVKVQNSDHITFTGGVVNAGVAINGIPNGTVGNDGSGNVQGVLTARGFTLTNSSHVTVSGVEVTQVARGIVLSGGDTVTLTNNTIHNLRTTPIDGGGVNHLVIDGNHLSDSHPYQSDHADFIHIWTSSSQKGPTTDVKITNNVIEQGSGAANLGINLEDATHKTFTGVTISGNVIADSDNQGIFVAGLTHSTVTNNVLLQTGGDAHDSPGIVMIAASADTVVSGNYAAFSSNKAGSLANIHDNVVIQGVDPSAAGYYSPEVVSQAEAAATTTAAYSLVASAITNAGPYVPTGTAIGDLSKIPQLDTFDPQRLSAHGTMLQVLVGGHGADVITGLMGNDTLIGGDGNDYLAGADGTDVLLGGAGADQFVFSKTYTANADTDTVVDFSSAQHDVLSVAGIDANAKVAGNQGFAFIGTAAFHHVADEIRYVVQGADVLVQGDVNGDGVADFAIKVMNVHSLQSSDFLL